MKNLINSELLSEFIGASFVTITTLFILFGCVYMKVSNINPRHAISAMVERA